MEPGFGDTKTFSLEAQAGHIYRNISLQVALAQNLVQIMFPGVSVYALYFSATLEFSFSCTLYCGCRLLVLITPE